MFYHFQVDGTDDSSDFEETVQAMNTMNMTPDEQSEVFQLVSGILHIGNILFREEAGDKAVIDSDERKKRKFLKVFQTSQKINF